MALRIKCPEYSSCGKIFSSEMSLQNHFRNVHDLSHRSTVVEKTLTEIGKQANNRAMVDSILTRIRESVLNHHTNSKQKSKVKRKLKKYINNAKRDWLKKRSRNK